MTQVALTTLSFEQYLHYSDRTDTRYKLVQGYLVSMPLPSRRRGVGIPSQECCFT